MRDLDILPGDVTSNWDLMKDVEPYHRLFPLLKHRPQFWDGGDSLLVKLGGSERFFYYCKREVRHYNSARKLWKDLGFENSVDRYAAAGLISLDSRELKSRTQAQGCSQIDVIDQLCKKHQVPEKSLSPLQG